MDWETALTGANAAYLEELLSTYQHDRNAVPETWRQFFDTQGRDFVAGPVPISDPGFRQRSIFDAPATGAAFDGSSGAMSNAQGNEGIFQLINAHRVRGHLNARLDPLGFGTPYEHPELTPAYWGFSDADLDQAVQHENMFTC